MDSEKFMKVGLLFVAFIFPILMMNKLSIFITTDVLSIYWLIFPLLISLGVLFKFKIARWLMLIGFWLLFFYEFIGTNTGMTTCFSNNIWTLVCSWSFASFISSFPNLSSLIIIYGFYIFILSNNQSYKLFDLDKSIRIHEIGTIGLSAFSIIYFNMIYYWFLV